MDKGQICSYCGIRNFGQKRRCEYCRSRLDSHELDVDLLQRVWEFAVFRKSFRAGGGWSIFWGIVAILIGLSQLSESSLNFLLFLIGLLLIGTGIAGRSQMSVGVIVGDALGLLLIGIWNVGFTILNASVGYQPNFFGILGVLQILWGIQRLRLIPRYNKIADVPMPIVEHVERLVNLVLEEPPNSNKMIAFKVKGNDWKALFTSEMVILVGDKAKEVRFVARNQFALSLLEKLQPLKPIMISIRLGKETWGGAIFSSHYKRYHNLSSADEVKSSETRIADIAYSSENKISQKSPVLQMYVVEPSLSQEVSTRDPVSSYASIVIRCPDCNQESIPGDLFCRTCGYKYADTHICQRCSQVLIQGDRFCRKCGYKIGQRDVSQQQPVPEIKV